MTNSVSLFGQSQAQSARLRDLQKAITDLQRQATTQKKYETISGLGAAGKNVLRNRVDLSNLNTYIENIDVATNRIKVMNTSLESARKTGEDLVSAISVQLLGGNVDIESIRTIAKNSLDFLQTLTNTEADGRFVFSGSATDTAPLANRSAVKTEMQSQVTNWLNGTNTTAQLLSNLNTMSDSTLGFDPTMSSAGPVSIRIDQDVEIDYSVVAPDAGFDKLMKALAIASELKIPDSATDVPDLSQFTTVLREVEKMAREGVDEIRSTAKDLSGTYAVAGKIRDQQVQDRNVIQNLIDDSENADTTEVLSKLKFMQVQLEAAYQVTSIVSDLSLVNYL